MEPASDRTRPVVRTAGVDVVIDQTDILHGVSFEVHEGRIVGLVGPNGSGKTTLLRAVSGLLPYRGEILIRGKSIRDWKPRQLARELAFVRQSVSLSFDFSVFELVLLGRTPHKRWLQDFGETDREHVRDALRLVDLEAFEDRSALSLSGGELQRVFLAQSLVQEAGLLLLDEPIAHLDVHYQFEFMDLVSELTENGRTVVCVFHDLEMAARYADEIVVLSRGRVAAAGSPPEVLTSECIADVFRMNAVVTITSAGRLKIEYLAPRTRRESNQRLRRFAEHT